MNGMKEPNLSTEALERWNYRTHLSQLRKKRHTTVLSTKRPTVMANVLHFPEAVNTTLLNNYTEKGSSDLQY